MSERIYWPLIRVILSATLTYTFALWLHSHRYGEVSLSSAAVICGIAGGLYTHLFEYLYHRVAMHHSFRLGRRRYYDKRHLKHHQLFVGDRFQTRDAARLKEVATSFYTFPLLFWPHYVAFSTLFPARLAPWFFLGVTLQFLAYEVSHWFTHVEDNAFDRRVSRIPLLSRLRTAQIRHHRTHHAAPAVNFNFTPPYLGDRWGRTASK